MSESRLCPKCEKMNLHRYTAHTIKAMPHGGVGGVEWLPEETYWKCVTPACGHREEEVTDKGQGERKTCKGG